MQHVQEETSEKTLRMMVKVSQLTAREIIVALEKLYRKLTAREHVGRTQLNQLMRNGAKIETTKIVSTDILKLDTDMKVFEQLARRFGVGYSIHKISDQPGYIIFFRSRQMEQVAAVLSEFNKYKFYRDFKAPMEETAKHRETSGYDTPDRKHQENTKLSRYKTIDSRLSRAKAQAAALHSDRTSTGLENRQRERGGR